MIRNKKVYVASVLRLIVLPCAIVAAVFGAKELVNLIFGTDIDNLAVYLTFFFTAMPLGLNTVVFPEAYGGDGRKGAQLSFISHVMSIITIPIVFSIISNIVK